MNRFIKVFSFVFCVISLFLFVSERIYAQVVINEISSFESTGDWIELYAFEDVDMSGWIIRDSATSIISTVENGTVVGPSANPFFIIDASNRLNKSGDIVKLYKSDDVTLVDQLPYGDQGGVCAPQSGQSIGRYPDANSTIERFSSPTQGTSNNTSTLNPCPSPTPEPLPTNTSTPKPTFTPKPTSTPIPTATSIPTNTSTLSPKPSTKEDLQMDKEEKSDVENREPEILGAEKDSQTPNSSDEINKEEKKFPLVAGALVLVGAGFLGFSAFLFLKNRKKV